jgi:hypothetical protein
MSNHTDWYICSIESCARIYFKMFDGEEDDVLS